QFLHPPMQLLQLSRPQLLFEVSWNSPPIMEFASVECFLCYGCVQSLESPRGGVDVMAKEALSSAPGSGLLGLAAEKRRSSNRDDGGRTMRQHYPIDDYPRTESTARLPHTHKGGEIVPQEPALTADEQKLDDVWNEHLRAEFSAHSPDETIV